MNRLPPKPVARTDEELERALHSLLASGFTVADARQRKVRAVVLRRIAGPAPLRFRDLLRWQIALPAALSLLLVGAALGWTVDERVDLLRDFETPVPAMIFGKIE